MTMTWRRIDKTQSPVPTSGDYRSWKPLLAREGRLQCVYCCIPESRFGGIRNFHVEHYRPQSLFPRLRNDYLNLFYACGICNVFKSDDWPADHLQGDLSHPAYPDPSQVDYGSFLTIDESTGEVSGSGILGRYIVERLHLNRPQMVAIRKLTQLFARIARFHESMTSLLEESKIPTELKDDVIKVLLDINKLTLRYATARPYASDQLR